MPGFDGTGPMGMGPMTGGGRGFCAVTGTARWPRYGRLGARGRWGGFGWGGATPYWGRSAVYPTITRAEEIDFLRDQAEAMREELRQIETRIDDLEKNAGQAKSQTS